MHSSLGVYLHFLSMLSAAKDLKDTGLESGNKAKQVERKTVEERKTQTTSREVQR